MENIYYVYGYIRLDTNTYFYIGKGKKNRASRLDNRKPHFVNILNKTNVCYEILYENLTEDEAFELERDTIEQLVFEEGYSIDVPNYECDKNKYAHLVNLTWGGDGTNGYSVKQSPSTIANRVAKNTGKKRSDKQKENILKGLKAYWEENPNHFNDIAMKRKENSDKWHSDETIEKIRQKAIGRERSSESVIKMLNTINNKSSEEKEKINKMRSDSVKNTKRKKSSLRLKILNKNKEIVKEFTTVMECAEWLVEVSVCRTVNGARDTINTKCNKDVLYKNKYYIIKEKLPLATTERENS